MAWFSTIADFKIHLGKDIDNSTSVLSITNYTETIIEENIAPVWLPNALIVRLEGLTTTGISTPKELEAIRLMRRCLAWFCVFYSAKSSLRTNDNGMIRHETEHTKSGYKYQEKDTRDHYEAMAFQSLEKLISYLDENADDFNDYKNSPQREKLYETFIKNATDFTAFSTKKINRTAFEHLFGTLEEIQDGMMSQFLPSAFYADLLDKNKANTLSVKEKEFISYLKKAICALTLEEAAVNNVIQFVGNSAFVREIDFNDGTAQLSVKAQQLDAFRYSQRLKTDRNLGKAKAFALKNIAELEGLFAPTDGTNTDADAWKVKEEETSECSSEISSNCGCSNSGHCGGCGKYNNNKIVLF